MNLKKDNMQYITFVSLTVCKFVFTFMPSEDEEQQSVESRLDLQLQLSWTKALGDCMVVWSQSIVGIGLELVEN